MKTLADQAFLNEALEALEKCHTEPALVEFDNLYTCTEQYLHLPISMVDELEAAYRKRVAHVLGGLA